VERQRQTHILHIIALWAAHEYDKWTEDLIARRNEYNEELGRNTKTKIVGYVYNRDEGANGRQIILRKAKKNGVRGPLYPLPPMDL